MCVWLKLKFSQPCPPPSTAELDAPSSLCFQTYLSPGNPNHAALEAKNLIQMADINDDGKLTIDEVLSNMELFLGSKMVDTGRNFHDEF